MTETCPHNHPRTAENTYRHPVTGYAQCKPCMRELAAARPRPSRRKAPKPPLDPAVIADLRAAAGLPPTKKGRAQ